MRPSVGISVTERAPGTGIPDARLITDAQAGDASAFDALMSARLDRTYRTARAILGNEPDARDAVQDAWLSIWRRLPSLREVAAFEGWVDRIVLNAGLTRGRRPLRRGPRTDDTLPWCAKEAPCSRRCPSQPARSAMSPGRRARSPAGSIAEGSARQGICERSGAVGRRQPRWRGVEGRRWCDDDDRLAPVRLAGLQRRSRIGLPAMPDRGCRIRLCGVSVRRCRRGTCADGLDRQAAVFRGLVARFQVVRVLGSR